ncbi:hypothetical protein [uncultured Duncaniella sp.]|uniref:hypothetical protein n=1 Tax=uncultured Duncaniella sp. TaxID=2768039 RepID=UPI0026052B16|nr:hypothetical protein [uncultured Duncaniella sp.]
MSIFRNPTRKIPVVIMVPISYGYADLTTTMTNVMGYSIMGDQQLCFAYGLTQDMQRNANLAADFIRQTISVNASNMPRILLFFYDTRSTLAMELLTAATKAEYGIKHVLDVWWLNRRVEVHNADVAYLKGPSLALTISQAIARAEVKLSEDEKAQIHSMLFDEKPAKDNQYFRALRACCTMPGIIPVAVELTEEEHNILAEAAESM